MHAVASDQACGGGALRHALTVAAATLPRMSSPHAIEVAVATRYLDDQSEPRDNRYVFAYTVRIRNLGETTAQLLTRRWRIVDADGFPQDVAGDGVVGQTPVLRPGEAFEYTSGAVLQTECGSMEGAYGMRDEHGREFEVPIERFELAMTRTLH